MNFSAQDIRRILGEHRPKTEDLLPGLRPASVLAPFHPAPEGLSLVFTKRTAHLDNHSGQISFPGGMRDQEDLDPLTTALRETYEEIGVRPEDIEVWGRLNQEATITGFSVAPFVGLVPYPYPFKLADFEVERLIIVPLAHLMDPDYFGEDLYYMGGRDYKTYKYTYKDDVIWGATARIVHNLLTLLATGREPDELEFLKQVVKPGF
ncbi:MAG: CoA pyrophosphatase [Thermodesulfobacteriota bacterium]